MCQRSEIRNKGWQMSTVMYSPQNHSRDMRPMRMLIHMYNKTNSMNYSRPLSVKSMNIYWTKIQDLLKQDFWSFIPTLRKHPMLIHFEGIHIILWVVSAARIMPWKIGLLQYEQITKGPPRKAPASYKMVRVQLIASGISSPRCLLWGSFLRSTWKPFEPLQPQTSWESS